MLSQNFHLDDQALLAGPDFADSSFYQWYILILFLLDSSCTETLFRIRMYDFLIVCAYDGSKVSMISLLPTFIFIISLQPFVVL
jgi:hypothetical protein